MLLVVGRIGRAHGVRGDLFVEPFTDSPDERFAPGQTLMMSNDQSLTVATSKWHSGRLVVHFVGIDDRTAAEALKGSELTMDVDPQALPEDPDEYYDHQLVGLTVVLTNGDVVGVVSEMVHLPSQDLVIVKRDGLPEAMIPFVNEMVPTIDVVAGTMTITPPPGLLNEAEAIVLRDDESQSSPDSDADESDTDGDTDA